jgi:hypothetical protein
MNILRNLLALGLILSALITGTVNANETVDCFFEASKSHPACQ